MKKIFYIALFSIMSMTEMRALLIQGDPDAQAGDSFSFDVGFAVFDAGSDQSGPRLWIASNDPNMNTTVTDAAKPYGLSYINQMTSYVLPGIQSVATPMTNQENATVYTFDGTTATSSSVPNPLWGGTFALFDVSVQKPAFVLTSDLTSFYFVQNIVHTANPTTTNPNVTNLVQYTFGTGQTIYALLKLGDTAFVAHAAGAFGTTASSIAEINLSAQAGTPYLKTVADTIIAGDTPALMGGGTDPVTLASNVTLGVTFNNFYVGVDVTAANIAATDRAVALSYITITADSLASSGYALQYNNVVPTEVLQQNNTISTVVSAIQAGEVRITNITGLATTTGLQYLVVARDTGNGTQQNIYAVPVASSGQIADFTSITPAFGTKPPLFMSRSFTTVISDESQIDIAGAFADQLNVGGTLPLAPAANNVIEQLYTVGDSVYAVIGSPYAANQTPGTFRSQPIFAQDGHIIGWSPWQRVLGSDQTMNYSFIDRKTLSGFYIAHATTSTGNFRAVNQTTFINDSNLTPILAPIAQGGIQGLFNFAQSTPGLNNTVSLMISTGFGAVAIGQTGKVIDTFFSVNRPMSTDDVIAFSNDAVNDHHALVAAEIAHDTTNNYHWIFVGGATGVSVLTGDTTGVTWSNNLADIDTNSLATGQNFKLVGNFTFVKKLVWDSSSTYLYILTSNELYRISLDPNKFSATPSVALNPELILQGSSLSKNPTYFLDMIIDNGFCILGTTNGLYTLNTTGGGVQKIIMPDGLPAATQLMVVSAAPEPQRTFQTMSNLSVLNSSFGVQQARLNRFTINNGIVTPFNDFIAATLQNGQYQGIASSFIKFDNYVSSYFNDGSWMTANSYYLGPNQPNNYLITSTVLQLFTGIHAGFSSSQLIIPSFSAYAPLLFLNGVTNLAGMIRESTSGSLIIFGNFPTQANV